MSNDFRDWQHVEGGSGQGDDGCGGFRLVDLPQQRGKPKLSIQAAFACDNQGWVMGGFYCLLVDGVRVREINIPDHELPRTYDQMRTLLDIRVERLEAALGVADA